MLIDCPECKKQVSSESPSCVHCGYPIKTEPAKSAPAPTIQGNQANGGGLGIFFIVLGIIAIIGGFVSMRPSEIEKLQGRLVELSGETKISTEAFYGSSSMESRDARDNVRDQESKFRDTVSKRHMRSAFWFVPGGVLFVLGLVLRASAKTTTK